MQFILALIAVLFTGTAASAQQFPLPGPFEHPGTPGSQPKCTKEYVAFLGTQKKLITEMRDKAPEQIQTVCTGIEQTERWARELARFLKQDEDALVKRAEDLIEALTGDLRRQFGVPKIDARWLKHTCGQAVGETARELTNQLGHIAAEEQRCAGV